MGRHVRPGDPLDISAASHNRWEDAADDNERRKLGGPSFTPGFWLPPGVVMIQNASGSALAQGRVLEIGASLLTTFDRRYPWFTGSTPAPNGTKEIAVTLQQMDSNDKWWCMSHGIVHARVNIDHEQHQYADVDNGSTLLKSKWYGRARIISRESTGTGEKNCWVRLGEMFRGPIEVVLTEAIAPGDSGDAKVRLNDADASPTSTIVVHYKHMEGLADAQNGADAVVFWSPDRQAFMLYELECAPA